MSGEINLATVASFFERGEVKALSKDSIKIGCRFFSRTEIEDFKIPANWSGGIWLDCVTNTSYVVTKADCSRALKMMDEYQGQPKTKWKPGQIVVDTLNNKWLWRLGAFDGFGWSCEYWDMQDRRWKSSPGKATFASGCREWPDVGDWVRCVCPSCIESKRYGPFRVSSESEARSWRLSTTIILEPAESPAEKSVKQVTWNMLEGHAKGDAGAVPPAAYARAILELRRRIEYLESQKEH